MPGIVHWRPNGRERHPVVFRLLLPLLPPLLLEAVTRLVRHKASFSTSSSAADTSDQYVYLETSFSALGYSLTSPGSKLHLPQSPRDLVIVAISYAHRGLLIESRHASYRRS